MPKSIKNVAGSTTADNTHSRAMLWAEPTVWDSVVQIKVKQIQIEQKYLLSYGFICFSQPKKIQNT